MKTSFVIISIFISLQALCQTTHKVIVRVNQQDGCPTITGLSESELDVFKVFPNPASEVLNIETPVYPANIKLVTEAGKIVQEKVIRSKEEAINIQGIPPGVYILYFKHSSISDHIKFIIK